jgi:hypothetical protein
MPQLPTLTIETPSGTERATLTGDAAERDAHVTEQGRARFRVDRAEWQTVADDINPRDDRFTIAADGDSEWFGGRFRDTERGGNDLVTVVLDDYERDAQDAQPTGGQKTFQNADDAAVVLDALSRVPTLSAGTVTTVASGVSYSFSNAEPAAMIRTAAQSGGALVRYNPDRTVDFVERPTAAPSVTLSPSSGTVVGDPDVRDDNRNPPTVIVGLGAQSGPNQVRAESVVDPNADREVYRKYTNTDIKNESRLQTIIDRLASEVASAPQKLDIETEAVDVDLSVGDRVEFVWPAEGIDTTLRVIEYTETITNRGRRYAPIRLANRWPEKGGADKAAEDLERFNSGYEGFVDRDNFSLDSQPVTDTLNAEDSYFYPDDVITEVRAEIRVRGRAYRAYSSGAELNTEYQNVFHTFVGYNVETLPVSGDFVEVTPEFSPSNPLSQLLNFLIIEDSTSPSISARLYDKTEDTYYPQNGDGPNRIDVNTPGEGQVGQTIHTPIGKDVSGNTLVWEAAQLVPIADETAKFAAFSDAIGTHTHPPDPGVTEFDLFPSNCDVLVNGTSAGVSLGDGTSEFAETVDISGLLTPGDNEIEITSDTTGRITGAIRTELFRQGPEDTV